MFTLIHSSLNSKQEGMGLAGVTVSYSLALIRGVVVAKALLMSVVNRVVVAVVVETGVVGREITTTTTSRSTTHQPLNTGEAGTGAGMAGTGGDTGIIPTPGLEVATVGDIRTCS